MRPPPGGRRRGPPPPPAGGGFLKILVVAALAVFVIAAAGAAALYLAGPTDLIRNQLIARVKAQTGRDLTVGGPTSFTVWPSLGVAMQDVTLSAPPGMDAPPLLTTKALTVRVGLLPLLKRQVTVDELVLTEPVFRLTADNSGRKSWEFSARGLLAPAGVRYAQAAPPAGTPVTDATPAPATSAPRKLPLEQLALGDVRIERGTVHYADDARGTSESVSDINIKVALPEIAGTANAGGDLVWRGEKLTIGAQLTSPKALIEEAPVRVAAKVSGRPLDLSYDGTLRLGSVFETEGDVALKGPSLMALAAYAGGSPTVALNGAGSFDLTGKLRAVNTTYTLSGLSATLDKAKASGDLAVTTGGDRPIIKGNIKLADLDLNPYLDAGTPPAAAPAAQPAPSPAVQPDSGGAQSIEDLLRQEPAPAEGPRVQGFTQRLGLSAEPLDLSALSSR